MKYLRPFNEAFTEKDIEDILYELRDSGAKVELKVGWIDPEIEEDGIEFSIHNKVSHKGWKKAHFVYINISKLNSITYTDFIVDLRATMDRLEEIGEVKSSYYTETNNGLSIEFHGNIQVITREISNEDHIEFFKNLLVKGGFTKTYIVGKGKISITLPKVNVPKLDKKYSEMNRQERSLRLRLINKLKYELFKEYRSKIKELIDPELAKRRMGTTITDNEGYSKLIVNLRAMYDNEEPGFYDQYEN